MKPFGHALRQVEVNHKHHKHARWLDEFYWSTKLIYDTVPQLLRSLP